MPAWVRKELREKGYTLTFEERTSGPITAIYFDRQHGSLWGAGPAITVRTTASLGEACMQGFAGSLRPEEEFTSPWTSRGWQKNQSIT
jgi:hypothetical protein